MIDVIFDLIMKEARSRHGNDLVDKIQTVLNEVDGKVITAMECIGEAERREKIDENQRSDN